MYELHEVYVFSVCICVLIPLYFICSAVFLLKHPYPHGGLWMLHDLSFIIMLHEGKSLKKAQEHGDRNKFVMT